MNPRSDVTASDDAWDDRRFDDSALWDVGTASPDETRWAEGSADDGTMELPHDGIGTAKQSLAQRLRRRRENATGDCLSIVVANDGGGYGKTTIALLMGMELADRRKGKVLAVDAAPGYGSLADRAGTRSEHAGTVRTAIDAVHTAGAVRIRDHAMRLPSGLDVLASDNTAADGSILTGADYELLMQEASGQYDMIVTDCSAGITSSVSAAALRTADALVIVSEGGGGVRSTTWLANYLTHQTDAHPHYKALLAGAVIVVNSQHANTNTNLDTVTTFYRRIVGAVLLLGFEPSLEGGAVIDPKRLSAAAWRQVRAISAAASAAGRITARP
ncbi:MAG: AAA family ATPase [Tomitella sp.]|nr:AAA family ATPase [Tomitella sp.]